MFERLTGLSLSVALYRLGDLDVQGLVEGRDGAEEQRDGCCDGRETHDVLWLVREWLVQVHGLLFTLKRPDRQANARVMNVGAFAGYLQPPVSCRRPCEYFT